jgi:hypothetical protein
MSGKAVNIDQNPVLNCGIRCAVETVVWMLCGIRNTGIFLPVKSDIPPAVILARAAIGRGPFNV